MSAKETGGNAFPLAHSHRELNGTNWEDANGMTLRQYAAIKLKVPDSGTDWLDEMITTSLRDYFAAKAMQGFASDCEAIWKNGRAGMAEDAYKWADAMLKARQI